jgi:hypothetical protein
MAGPRQQLRRQDAGRQGAAVGVVGEEIPAAEHQVREGRERHDVGDRGMAAVAAMAAGQLQPLGESAIGLGEAFVDEGHPGDQGGGHRPKAWQEDAELPLRQRDSRGRLR